MPRSARIVLPNYPHHVIQRGNRNQTVFFSEEDKQVYLDILKDKIHQYGVRVWAWCLMDTHVHFTAVPEDTKGLTEVFSRTHWLYSRRINFRHQWRGYLWQGRFKSFVMDETYLYAAVRYIERNPLEAGLVDRPEDYPYSSARSRVLKTSDPILSHCHLVDEISDWSEYLKKTDKTKEAEIRASCGTQKPLGLPVFVEQIAKKFDLSFEKKKPGPKNPRLQKEVKDIVTPFRRGLSMPCNTRVLRRL